MRHWQLLALYWGFAAACDATDCCNPMGARMRPESFANFEAIDETGYPAFRISDPNHAIHIWIR